MKAGAFLTKVLKVAFGFTTGMILFLLIGYLVEIFFYWATMIMSETVLIILSVSIVGIIVGWIFIGLSYVVVRISGTTQDYPIKCVSYKLTGVPPLIYIF